MDEKTRAEFAALREETRAAFAKTDAALNALLKLMNDQHERLIDQIKSLSHDFQNTKGFLMR